MGQFLLRPILHSPEDFDPVLQAFLGHDALYLK
jgi:hypothetical protein